MKGPREDPTDLCTDTGSLNPDAVGWTRRPLHRCNLGGHKWRKKRWNYWAVQNERFFLAAGVADLDYAATAFVYLVDIRRRVVVEKSAVSPLGRGCVLGEHVSSRASFRSRRITVAEAHDDPDVTSLLVTCDDFDEGDRLSAALRIHYPPGVETLGVVVPMGDGCFQYTSKHVGIPASGRVRIGRREIPFDGESAFATLDFGRGVWPRRTEWNWGAGAASVDGRTIAINVGGKWTDGTGSTENALFLDGRIVKVHEDLEWSYEEADPLKPWRVRAPRSGALDLLFEPIVERKADTDVLLVRSSVRQVFGIWSGTARGEDGETVEVPFLFGWAEFHKALW